MWHPRDNVRELFLRENGIELHGELLDADGTLRVAALGVRCRGRLADGVLGDVGKVAVRVTLGIGVGAQGGWETRAFGVFFVIGTRHGGNGRRSKVGGDGSV